MTDRGTLWGVGLGPGDPELVTVKAARVIGEATVPQRRTFPPAMSMIAMLGFMMGAFAASAWTAVSDRLAPDTGTPEPAPSETATPAPPAKPVASDQPRQEPQPATVAAAERCARNGPSGWTKPTR